MERIAGGWTEWARTSTGRIRVSIITAAGRAEVERVKKLLREEP